VQQRFAHRHRLESQHLTNRYEGKGPVDILTELSCEGTVHAMKVSQMYSFEQKNELFGTNNEHPLSLK